MLRLSLTSLLFVLASQAPANDTAGFAEAFETKQLELKTRGTLVVAGHNLHGHRLVDQIYARNDFMPLWNASNREAFIVAVGSLREDGLEPTDYFFPEIASFVDRDEQGQLSPAERLELDLLLSEGLIRALYNLAFGKVDAVALDSSINFSRPLNQADVTSLLIERVTAGDIAGLLDWARPEHETYDDLREALRQYRGIQDLGGWPTIPDGKTLKPGELGDERIPLIARRLSITGDLTTPADSLNALVFDGALVDALKRFQQRHNLDPDGVLGAQTLAALNVPVEQRIDQIRVNLERLRWYLHAIEDEFIFVNIAGFRVFWVKDDAIVWEQLAQVGQEFTKTPVFKDEIEYLDFNPTWTIPPGILQRTVIPGLKKDPDYLEKNGYELLSLDGSPVDPGTVDWQTLDGFPFIVRQPPGPNNALGLVKFMFPNPHLVFLHDTNARHLFDRTRRTFSSGCIRVKEPFDLAERLLRDKDGWDRARIDEVVASGVTTRVLLDKPMPIIIGYATAMARDGQVLFREDIYQRDQPVLDRLNAEFRVRKEDT
jgi:murein L,D-transpeptidase YcbB/YkuD